MEEIKTEMEETELKESSNQPPDHCAACEG